MDAGGDNSHAELEYFSAEEESVSQSDTDESVKVRDLSICPTDNRQPRMTMEEKVSANTTSTGSQSWSHCDEQKQGRSKKQKRRRRNKLKSLQPKFEFPFANIENIDYYSEFMGYSNNILRSHIRIIPSLFKLCLDAMTNRKSKVSKSCSVYPVVKDVLSYMQEDQELMNIQLSWMHQLLYYFEHTDMELEHMILETDLEVASRNIWNNSRFDPDLWALPMSPYNYLGNPDSTILLYTNQSSQLRWKMDFLNMSAITSVVASVTESMLPEHVSAIRLHHSSRDCRSESQLIQKITEAMVSTVRRKFRKRYPKIYRHLFDRALPYVFWARGNISFAAECFLRFAQTKEEGPYKAMILNEAARLYAQNNESSRAYRLYMESAGVTDENSSAPSSDLILQKYMLMASVYDQGLMTSAKAVLAAKTWNAAMTHLDDSTPGISTTRAVESFLCLHCGTAAENVQDRLEDCVKLTERLALYCGDLLLHLSLLKALLGDGQGSSQVYKSLTFRKEVHNPWQPVLDHVQGHGIPKFMEVMWRTQLGHLCIVSGLDSFEGDHISSADLNLRLTDAGFLTADMQMVLPPIRALNLDPYTGFNFHTPRQTHAWHSISEVSHEGSLYLRGLHLVPTLSELYCDETGNSVHFLAPYAYETSALKDWKTEIKPVKLLWTGASGQRARVNLSKLVKQFLKQKAIVQIFSNPDRPKKWKEEMMVAAEYCYASGYNTGFSTVSFVHNYLWDKVVASSQYRDMYGKSDKSELRKTEEVPQHGQSRHRFLAVLTEYFPYKDTLYLSLYVPEEDNSVMVFVDCTNEATFLEPVITTDFSSNPWSCAVDDLSMSSIQVPKAVKKYRQFPQDEIMWHFGRRSQISPKVFVVYGKGGRVLKIFSQDTMPTPYVLGNKLYGLVPDGTRVKCNPVTADEILSEEFPVITTLLFGGNKVMAVTNSTIYFLNPDTLQTLSVIQQQDSCSLKVSEDGRHINFLPGSQVKILEQKEMEEMTRLVFGIGSTLMFVDVTDNAVEVVMELKLPGPAIEVYTINAVGFLVSFKIQHHNTELQREHVFHYNHHGKILGILPFLGPGPRCFCVEYLKGQEEVTNTDSGHGREGWHVFMRDGHEGIIGVRL